MIRQTEWSFKTSERVVCRAGACRLRDHQALCTIQLEHPDRVYPYKKETLIYHKQQTCIRYSKGYQEKATGILQLNPHRISHLKQLPPPRQLDGWVQTRAKGLIYCSRCLAPVVAAASESVRIARPANGGS